jgi:Replication factor-A C terminal domain
MGITSEELFLLEFEEQDRAKFSEIIRSVQFKQFIFKLKIKEEIYNGEKQVKSIVMNAEKVEPSSESKYLLRSIPEMLIENQSSNQNLSPNCVPVNMEAWHNLYLRANEPHCNRCGSDGHNCKNCPHIKR